MFTSLITQGIKAAKTAEEAKETAHFVSFFVFTKHDTNEKADVKHFNMHMCVYTIRSIGKTKDSIYFDPSPECYGHAIPKCIRDLQYPKMTKRRSYGIPSLFEDCAYQCFKYVLALHTGEMEFAPDLKQIDFNRVR